MIDVNSISRGLSIILSRYTSRVYACQMTNRNVVCVIDDKGRGIVEMSIPDILSNDPYQHISREIRDYTVSIDIYEGRLNVCL